MIIGEEMEIERKFLVNLELVAEELQESLPIAIRQAYLVVDEMAAREVRIRDRGGKYSLTVKAGSGLVREEREITLSEEQFLVLLGGAQGRVIEKQRYEVPVRGYQAEVDVYEGHLSGLVTVEVEFPTKEEARAFIAPDWFGEEKTGDLKYSNRYLSTL
ncbi:MAG: CYTH domain-containing protein [Bdellovibrionota bacterium]